jgi:hypothetical protein
MVDPDRRHMTGLQTATQNMQRLLFFNGKNGYANALLCYIYTNIVSVVKLRGGLCLPARDTVRCTWRHIDRHKATYTV